MSARINGLSGSPSPFLQHGASQPVAWLPWGEAAFERARARNRPILLDIGAVWCHWCHVMDRESYENEDVAQLINERFVPVKVDRDERPDVDARYQRAVQVLTGQGGWPLTAFLTPDGEVFYGGTYFPPFDAHGRPSFTRVLREVSRIWTDEPARAGDAARGVRERLESYALAEAAPGEPAPALIDQALEELADTFDFRYGGFGRAPKFPNAGALDLLLDEYLDHETAWAGRVVVETLRAMADGGIHDQLGGGFHRYATDARWLIPHFEKMAYDNGTLLEIYARAHSALGEPLYAEVVDGILAHYRDVAPALVAAGGFPASQDADHGPDDDGDYWTWSAEELRAALPDERSFEAVRLRFGLDDPGGSMHLDPDRHVLFRAMPVEQVAARLELTRVAADDLLADAAARLKRARDARPRPFVDETLYAGWAAMVACGHLAAARHLHRQEAAAAALAALDHIWTAGFDPAIGVSHRIGDSAAGAYLDDQAHVARALLDAFELTQDGIHLQRARRLADLIVNRFADASGGFRDRAADAPAGASVLEQPHLPIADAPAPSGNATLALVLLRLNALTSEPRYRTLGLGVLHAFAGSVSRLGASAATYNRALAWAVRPVTTVAVIGRTGATKDRELLEAALRPYRPRTIVRWFEAGAVSTEALPAELAAMITGDAPRAYLCTGRTCAAPVSEPAALAALFREFRG